MSITMLQLCHFCCLCSQKFTHKTNSQVQVKARYEQITHVQKISSNTSIIDILPYSCIGANCRELNVFHRQVCQHCTCVKVASICWKLCRSSPQSCQTMHQTLIKFAPNFTSLAKLLLFDFHIQPYAYQYSSQTKHLEFRLFFPPVR